MTLAAIFALFTKFKPILIKLVDGLKLIKENPKTVRIVVEVLLVGYVVFCILVHLRGCGNPYEQKIVTKDTTIYVFPDSSKWTRLLGDTIAYYANLLEKGKYINRPLPEVPVDADTCDTYLAFYMQQLALCDSDNADASAQRGYKGTVESDSFRIRYDIDVFGRLSEEPVFDVQHKFPSEHRTTETMVFVPRLSRAAWIDVGAGPSFNYGKEMKFSTLKGSISGGYSDRKGNGYGARVSADAYNWSIEAVYRKSFLLERPKN